MKSPRPAPPRLVERDFSTRKNLSKIRGKNSGSIPWPVSATFMSTAPSPTEQESVTVPPGAVYSIALSRRLVRTSSSRSGSVLSVTAEAGVSRRRLTCLLYTSDAADDLLCVDLGGRRIIKKKKKKKRQKISQHNKININTSNQKKQR